MLAVLVVWAFTGTGWMFRERVVRGSDAAAAAPAPRRAEDAVRLVAEAAAVYEAELGRAASEVSKPILSTPTSSREEWERMYPRSRGSFEGPGCSHLDPRYMLRSFEMNPRDIVLSASEVSEFEARLGALAEKGRELASLANGVIAQEIRSVGARTEFMDYVARWDVAYAREMESRRRAMVAESPGERLELGVTWFPLSAEHFGAGVVRRDGTTIFSAEWSQLGQSRTALGYYVSNEAETAAFLAEFAQRHGMMTAAESEAFRSRALDRLWKHFDYL